MLAKRELFSHPSAEITIIELLVPLLIGGKQDARLPPEAGISCSRRSLGLKGAKTEKDRKQLSLLPVSRPLQMLLFGDAPLMPVPSAVENT